MSKDQRVTAADAKYETTYSKTIYYDVVEDFISISYIELFIEKISQRLNIKKSDIEVSVARGDHKIRIRPNSLESVFQETAKNSHVIDNIQIKPEIHFFDDVSHGIIEVVIRLKNEDAYFKKSSVSVRVYAVGENKISSQAVVDWGRGTLLDFERFKDFRQQTNKGELVIDELSRKVVKMSGAKDDNPISVQVTSPVSIEDRGFKELKKPYIIIPILLTVVGIIATIIIELL